MTSLMQFDTYGLAGWPPFSQVVLSLSERDTRRLW